MSIKLVISKTLKRLGCQVDIAENGKEAVDLLRESHIPYDLVFMDCQMPVMDGYEATRVIRSLSGHMAKTPIIALTASAMPEDRAKAMAARMDDYLSKPVKLFALKAALEKWAWKTLETDSVPVEKEPEKKQTRILVVEDNPTNQKVVCSLLKKLDCQVEVAEDGIIAVECVRAATVPFDLIFMDCHMPNMDGYDATRAIRNLPGSAGQLPIVALTAASSQGDIDRSIAAGMNAHLTKPARKKALQEAIEQWAGVEAEMSLS